MQTRGLFITATDTGVGKTYVAALAAREIARGDLRVGVYKPACSGAQRSESDALIWEDVAALESATEHRFDSSRICPQRFAAPLAPPIAAKVEGKQVDAALLRSGAQWWVGRVDVLIVEGVGGILCPLTEEETVADLAREFGYPVLIVARLGLGTINHTLLTIEAAKSRGLDVAGILLNESESVHDIAAESNESEIARRSPVPVVGVIRHGVTTVLKDGRPVTIDWQSLAAAASRR